MRAVPKRRNLVFAKLQSFNQNFLLNEGNDTGRKLGGNMGNQMSNINLNQLGSNQQQSPIVQSQGRNWSKGGIHNDELEYEPMDLISEEENDPIAMLEGKKRQRVVIGPLVILGL